VTLIAPMDSLYLWGESDTSPTHVVSLQLFRPSGDGGSADTDAFFAAMLDASSLKQEFGMVPWRSWSTAGQFAWKQQDPVDLEQHVSRVRLPAPGRVRELLEHLASFHAERLPRDRPLWAAHLVEGLTDGRVALCVKMHHSLFDGVSMGRHLLGGLSTDEAATDCVFPWQMRAESRDRPRKAVHGRLPTLMNKAAKAPARAGQTLAALVDTGISSAMAREGNMPFAAPMTMLNGRVDVTRRFVGQKWDRQRIRSLATRAGVSTNDVGLAMCAGALRRYLLEQDALPRTSLVALVPISMRDRAVAEVNRGNSWGSVLCPLATDIADPKERLRRIHESMSRAKRLMTNVDPATQTLISLVNMGGAILNLVPHAPRPPRAPFNLIISNVPISEEVFFHNGWELQELYGASVVGDGQALNITLSPYADAVAFNLTACPTNVPHLQRILDHLESSLAELEACVDPAAT
jgi:diacylglycerol O-acyltransferase